MTLRHRVHKVIYVPLDDRAYSLKQVRFLAQMVDYDLLMPPLELLGWFTTPGQPEPIWDWLMAEADNSADAAIVSLDMLAYGGLVASRSPQTRTQLALQRLGNLAELRRRAGEMPILASSILMRLAMTTATEQSTQYWAPLRRYSELVGLMEGNDREVYREELERVKQGIPADLLGQYLACRERNHIVNRRAVEQVAAGNLDFLALTQEDASPQGLHRTEQQELLSLIAHAGLQDRVHLYCGADETGSTLLARFVHQHMQKVPRVYILPSSAAHMRNIAMFEDRPFSQVLEANVRVIGGELTNSPDSADLVLAVNAPQRRERAHFAAEPNLATRRHRNTRFAGRIAQLDHPGLAICDVAFANGAEDSFVTALLDAGIQPLSLLSFAGWNTAGNSAGSALAHGTLRLIALQDKGAFDLASVVVSLAPLRYLELLNSLITSEKAHVSLLFHHLVDDWLYQARVRPAVTEIAVNMLKTSVFDLASSYPRAEAIVRDELARAATDLWIEQFLGQKSVSIGSPEAPSALALTELEETRVRLPWRRLFEVDLDFEFGMQMVAGS